jgi:hypothetical protein
VAFDNPSDKSTWRIIYDPNNPPTQQQIAAAQNVVANFDVAAATQSEAAWRAAIESDPDVMAMLARARTASVADINTWVTNKRDDAVATLIKVVATRF